jgi:hypothetical protein
VTKPYLKNTSAQCAAARLVREGAAATDRLLPRRRVMSRLLFVCLGAMTRFKHK